MGEGRGLGRVLRVEADLAGLDALEDVHEAVDVHRLVHAVVDGLADERVVGDLDGAGLVLLAADELREDGGHEVVGAHALDRRRDLLALALAEDGERAGGVPAPAGAEHRRDEQRLLDGLLGALRLHEVEHVRRAGSCAAGRSRGGWRRRWPRPAARSRSRRRSACAARGPRRG